MAKHEIVIKQICTGQWGGEWGGSDYTTIALSEDGKVYKYDVGKNIWVPYVMFATEEDEV